MKDLHELPKLRDSLSYLYVQHAGIHRDDFAIEIEDDLGRTAVPAASLAVLMLGPGTRITHAAVAVLAENGCSVLWVGEDATRCYASGTGETRKGYRLLRQAALVSDPAKRSQVVRNMYQFRFSEALDPGMSLPQIRGKEGVRVRKAYSEAAKLTGVRWRGRNYDRGDWDAADPINRALSAGSALLNGICHAAIISGGYSTGLGFIHTGRQLSFVYDVADLYKADLIIPLAFSIVSRGTQDLEARVRRACRDLFREAKLLERILPDIDRLMEIDSDEADAGELLEIDDDRSLPVPLWEALWEEGAQPT